MLYLTRRVGQSVIINDTVSVTVLEARGKTIKLGFVFPPEASVLRKELYERIQEENKTAAQSMEQAGLGDVFPHTEDELGDN